MSVNLRLLFVIINKVGIKINADVNVKNCECECDKACNVGEYLDYENCKCRKTLA